MTCDAAKSKVFAYVDGELAPDARAELAVHLAACWSCRRLVELELAFREEFVDRLRPDPAPLRVRQQVAHHLHGLAERRRERRGERRARRVMVAVAAGALLAVGVTVGIGLQSFRQHRNVLAELTDASVEQHQKLVRGLLPPDITGVSPKGAEAWFGQRLSFRVALPELKSDNLAFVGGRISHLVDVEVAALEYRVDDKHVSLFIMPEETYERLQLKNKPKFTVLSHRGYDVIIWRHHGTGYTLVSEIGSHSCLVCHSPDEKLDL